MDQEIGRILDQIRAMGQFENTFICFLSDNGASAEIMVRGEGHDPDAPMGSAATYLCLGPGFSSAANTPFRRHKTWVHEGGVSTPMIVSWPRGIAARNELRRTVGHVVDIAPTILDIAGIGPPTDAPVPMSGRSMRATFAADGQELHEQLWFSHDGHRALRQGDWKIVHAVPTPIVKSGKRDRDEDTAFATLNWSLYNLASDRAEQNDLSQQHPQRVQHMASAWKSLRDQFLKDASVKDASENDASETGVE
jgi:arylsulfatase